MPCSRRAACHLEQYILVINHNSKYLASDPHQPHQPLKMPLLFFDVLLFLFSLFFSLFSFFFLFFLPTCLPPLRSTTTKERTPLQLPFLITLHPYSPTPPTIPHTPHPATLQSHQLKPSPCQSSIACVCRCNASCRVETRTLPTRPMSARRDSEAVVVSVSGQVSVAHDVTMPKKSGEWSSWIPEQS